MGQRAYDQYLERRYRETKESIDFFSDQNKAERERCIVRAFFRCLGVSFTEKDLQVNQLEPIDVAALGGRFQVTEVLAPSRRRHQQYKERLESLNKVSSVNGLFEPWQNPKPVPWGDLVEWVLRRLSNKTAHGDIDALGYINRDQTFLDINSPKPNFSSIAKLGWRSVSVVYLPYSVVMSAADSAPAFIKNAIGSAQTAWTKPDGWFEPDA